QTICNSSSPATEKRRWSSSIRSFTSRKTASFAALRPLPLTAGDGSASANRPAGRCESPPKKRHELQLRGETDAWIHRYAGAAVARNRRARALRPEAAARDGSRSRQGHARI